MLFTCLPAKKRAGMLVRMMLLLLLVEPASGQLQLLPASNTPAQDPLMALMLSQPRIDVDSPVVPIAEFDPPIVELGEEAVYRITFNALETSIVLPATLPTTPPLNLIPGAHGQILIMTGTNYQPRASFLFRVRATHSGDITIPEFAARVYGKPVKIPAARLQVVAAKPPTTPPAQRLTLELPQTNLYVGQAVRASIILPPGTSLLLQNPSPLLISGKGFVVDANTVRPRMEPRRLGGVGPNANIPSIAYDVTLTPIASGNLTAFAQAFIGSRLATQIIYNSSGVPVSVHPQYIFVDSDLVEFKVLPLPSGPLPGFTGAVGSFIPDVPQLSTNMLHVGDPVKLTVKIRGEGNLVRLLPPPPPRVREWRIHPGGANTTHPQIIQAQGFTTFNYILIPLTEQVQTTPPIPFSCFDPAVGRFVDSTIAPLPVTVLPGKLPADFPLLLRADEAAGAVQKEPALSGLAHSPGRGAHTLVPVQRRAWFPFVHLAPAAAFFGGWFWERRRRFRERHPDVVLRRRALRALRKQRRHVRQAAHRGAAPEFASAAVTAMRVGCSPFYPAEPRALVGSDVLNLLPEPERSGRTGQVVRQFFDTTDASQFSVTGPNPVGLLDLQPELEAVLQNLEQKLRA